MIEEHSQDDGKRAHSVHRNDAQIDIVAEKGFSVKPSPFNPVKLELGYMLLVAVLLFLVVHRVTDSPWKQTVILLVFGLLGMLRLVHRVRQVARQQSKVEE